VSIYAFAHSKSVYRNMIYHDAHDILPDEECILCAEKHYSYAMELAEEIGYVAVNRQKIIGQLTAAQWHIFKYDVKLANDMRDIRHLVQERQHDLIDWKPICIALDALIEKDKAENKKIFESVISWASDLLGAPPPESKISILKNLFEEFSEKKNSGGGCSSCRLKRIKREYRAKLTEILK
jgi:hypothetical protein